MASPPQFFVERIDGRPAYLARCRWPDVSEAIGPNQPEWTHDGRLMDMLYDSSGEIVTEEEAKRIAAGWGSSLP
jgi:hypothetical protein